MASGWLARLFSRSRHDAGEDAPDIYFGVLSIFQRPDLVGEAYVDDENPWGKCDPLYDYQHDRIFMVSARDFYIGHVRIYDNEHLANRWLESMKTRTNVWALWRLGAPLGPFAEDGMYKEADGELKFATIYGVPDTSDPQMVARACLELSREHPQHALISFGA